MAVRLAVRLAGSCNTGFTRGTRKLTGIAGFCAAVVAEPEEVCRTRGLTRAREVTKCLHETGDVVGFGNGHVDSGDAPVVARPDLDPIVGVTPSLGLALDRDLVHPRL